MPDFSYDILGQDRLLAIFALLKEIDDKDVGEALMVGGEIIKDAAQSNIRSQGLIKTRELHDSITLEKRRGTVKVGTPLGFRAWIHERGGTIRAKRKQHLVFSAGSGVRKVKSVTLPSRPFLRPAVEENQDQVATKTRDKLINIIRSRVNI